MAYLAGLTLGLSMIISIGMQNLFVIQQSLKRQHHYLSALICSLSDTLLVILSFTGAGLAIQSLPILQIVLWVFAILFLLGYASFNLYTLKKGHRTSALPAQSHRAFEHLSPKIQVILAGLAFSLLNPQGIIELFVIIGGITHEYPTSERIFFILGTISSSFIWFFSLSYFISRAAHSIHQKSDAVREKIGQGLHVLSALLMLMMALYFIQHLHHFIQSMPHTYAAKP